MNRKRQDAIAGLVGFVVLGFLTGKFLVPEVLHREQVREEATNETSFVQTAVNNYVSMGTWSKADAAWVCATGNRETAAHKAHRPAYLSGSDIHRIYALTFQAPPVPSPDNVNLAREDLLELWNRATLTRPQLLASRVALAYMANDPASIPDVRTKALALLGGKP
jgi:hypothetical protein